jgi:hypothetical protein
MKKGKGKTEIKKIEWKRRKKIDDQKIKKLEIPSPYFFVALCSRSKTAPATALLHRPSLCLLYTTTSPTVAMIWRFSVVLADEKSKWEEFGAMF